MGDLNRGLPRRRLPIEREQAVTPEGVHDRVDGTPADVERLELTPADASTGVLATLAEGDETQEDLLDRSASAGVHRRVDALGSGGQGARDPADLPVSGRSQPVPITPFEKLRERVLQQG